MKLRIIKWKNVVDHCQSDPKMMKAFQRFYEKATKTNWARPQDIISTFRNSDLVTCKKERTSRIVINIGHNKYRLIAGYYFAPNQTILYVKFVGTHKEYDAVDVCKIDMFKQR